MINLKNVTAKDVQYNITRPTSTTAMLLLFQIFKEVFPHAMSENWQDITLNGIAVLGSYGVLEKIWVNRKEIKEFFTNIIKKKK